MKAQNLGLLHSASEIRHLVPPGVALLQPDDFSTLESRTVMEQMVSWLERMSRQRFGDSQKMPLLLAVRSSPFQSSPGIATSIVYVGMNESTVQAMSRATSPAIAYRTYAWFLKNFAKSAAHENIPDNFHFPKPETMTWEEYAGLLLHTLQRSHIYLPQDPIDQCVAASRIVFRSMRDHGLSGSVIFQQAMVIDDHPLSGAGVYFTRSLKDGSAIGCGRFASGIAGSEVVTGDAGIELSAEPSLLNPLNQLRRRLEKIFVDALDVEFISVRGALRLLQARPMVFAEPEIQIGVWKELVRGGVLAAQTFPQRVFRLHESSSNIFVVRNPEQLKDPIGHGTAINQRYAAKGKLITVDELSSQKSGSILYTEDPDDSSVLLAVWRREIAGVITPGSHEYSHVAVLARTQKIPTLVQFSGDLSSLLGQEILLDESTGAVYAVNGDADLLLAQSAKTNASNYLGIDPAKIAEEVEKEIEGFSLPAIAAEHDRLLDASIQAVRKGQFEKAAYLTFKAHFFHLQIKKLQTRDRPFEVYAWDHELSSDVKQLYPRGGPELNRYLRKEAFTLDPMFQKLAEIYGPRMKIIVEENRQSGQYLGPIWFYRISAIIEGGSPYLFYRQIRVGASLGIVVEFLLKKWRQWRYQNTLPPDIRIARKEAEAVAEQMGGTIVEYDLVHDYHDRGLLSGTKVIGVLPAGIISPDPTS